MLSYFTTISTRKFHSYMIDIACANLHSKPFRAYCSKVCLHYGKWMLSYVVVLFSFHIFSAYYIEDIKYKYIICSKVRYHQK